MENKEEKKKEPCPDCTRHCDGATLCECEECGEVHCANCKRHES